MPQNPKGPRLYFKKRRDGSPSTYVIIDGKTQFGTGCGRGNIEQAREKLTQYLKKTYRADTSERDLAKIGCADVINLYATDIAPTKASELTIKYQGKALLSFWGDKTLAEVRGPNCRAYVKKRIETLLPTRKGQPQRKVGTATARQELKLLGRSIKHWKKECGLSSTPEISLPEATSRRERYLEREEVARMLRAAKKLKYAHIIRFILIGLYTGTRHHAILSLRWMPSSKGGHVDCGKGLLFRRGWSEAETKKRRPTIRLDGRILAHLKRWNHMDAESGMAIVNYKGSPLAKIKRAWNSVCRDAALGAEVTPHVLRHTAVTWMLRKGRTTWDVAGIIGADASTVERVYGHHMPLDKERERA